MKIFTVPEGDECTPNPCGPNSGCRSINGVPTCFCLPEYEGAPPNVPCQPPQTPCDPSPCGPNTQCTQLSNGFAKCTCLPGYIESPNTIRGCVEPKNPCEPNPCGLGASCDAARSPVCYCPEPTVGNPFRQCTLPSYTPELCRHGACGENADCFISSNRELCYCHPGYVGDPYVRCQEPPRSVCEPNPCGPRAQCIISESGHSMCRCPDGLGGDPTSVTGCHGYECAVDSDCASNEACLGFRCRDPCPGSCGVNAFCKAEKHHPVCFCEHGLTGNPLSICYAADEPQRSPCVPDPCGVNTECHVLNNRAVCSCLPDYLGDPQSGCRPECIINSDCPSEKSCINKRCESPCSGSVCGINAECRVYDHTANCICHSGYAGDAFIQCVPIPVVTNTTSRPCSPSPCGPQDICSVYGDGIAICDPCADENAHNNPLCRPECLMNSDCAFNRACLGQRCLDPCPGSCGQNALCKVINHSPVCSCPQGLYGNPYEHCTVSTPIQPKHPETCDTIQCGPNTECRQQNGVLACVCRVGYYGNPLVGCRPECVINPDCPSDKSCADLKCVNPCLGACGVNALCQVVNHFPVCYCPPDHTGNAAVSCSLYQRPSPPIYNQPINPCDPSPCGPNSRCRLSNGYAVCSCLPGYRGSPPVCQPECVDSSECPQNQACINLKCVDPCPGTCGIGARCEVLYHKPICSCHTGETGDPFISCHIIPMDHPPGGTQENPCSPSPCGPNSICQIKQGRPVCSCAANYISSPPYCRPECVLSNECPQDKACIQEKCQNPCAGTCGANAECHVINHSAYCNCLQGYQGDAFVGCSKTPDIVPSDSCNPSPCGENAQCTVLNGAARCACIPPYIGDPYSNGCRPECVYNADCSGNTACIRQHCRDPCPGVCGVNAQCAVVNHIPTCACEPGYHGDPFTGCRREPLPCEYSANRLSCRLSVQLVNWLK